MRSAFGIRTRRFGFTGALLLCALLSACGGSHHAPSTEPGGGEPASTLPAVPTGLSLTYGVNAFTLSWNAVSPASDGSAITYRVMEDPDGPGAGPSTPVSTGLSATAYTYEFSGLLHTRLNANYSVQACNATGCSPVATPLNINVNQAIGYFKASNPGVNGQFGESLALSGDGNTLAVGAIFDASGAVGIDGDQSDVSASGAGAVYVFARTGGIWAQQAYVKASNTGASDLFGHSVALSSDGHTLAVGASDEDSAAVGINGDELSNAASGAGAVYVFVRSGSSWSQQAYVKASNTGANDSFGLQVGLTSDGDTLAVAAPEEASNATGVGGDETNDSLPGAGAVYTFTRSLGTWTQQAYIKASNPGGNDSFGAAMSLARDGSTLAVGARSEASDSTGINGDGSNNNAAGAGAAYVFARSGPSWAQQAYVKASNAEASDRFGTAVALSADGSTMVVSAQYESSGTNGINGDATDNSVNASGAAFVFTRSGGTWSQEAYVKASNPRFGAFFGYAVALSSDGNTLAVGATHDSSSALGINGDQSLTDASLSGAVYLYARSGASWSQSAYLKAANTAGGDLFGNALSLSADGHSLAVGAHGEDSSATGVNGDMGNDGANNAGAVYLY